MDSAKNLPPIICIPLITRPKNLTCKVLDFLFDKTLLLEGSGESLDELRARHNVTVDDLIVFNKDKVFLKKVEGYRNEIVEKGMTFKLKARAQAEELLTTSWTLIHSPETSSAVKADLIKSTVKWGGLETKTDTAEDANGGVKITINLGGQELPTTVIDAEQEPAAIGSTK